MSLLSKIFIAYILDLIFGDPINVTHPVQIIGKLIDFLEKNCISKRQKKRKNLMLKRKKWEKIKVIRLQKIFLKK